MKFEHRHLGSGEQEIKEMLKACGENSLNDLVNKTIPKSIRLQRELDLVPAKTEKEYLDHIATLGAKNKVIRSLIGMGYYGTIVPPVIQRNILENPGWYTAYTPYQAEIAQGRLEALINFQTMVSDLTGMPLANASLLDEGTAAAEGMIMLYNSRSRQQQKENVLKYFVDKHVFPQTMAILETRAEPLGIELVIGSFENQKWDESYFGGMVQYPNDNGEVRDHKEFVEKAHEVNAKICVAADIMSLTILVPPGEWGADVVVGNTQRFGVPMGYGGPHAAYFATKEELKRNIPGRIIGVSKDRGGGQAYRMALQTREQHIRRDKATSNICTAQALLAIMAGMYAVYHGPEGLRNIGEVIHKNTCFLESKLKELGYSNSNQFYFDTLCIETSKEQQGLIRDLAEEAGYNFRYFENGQIGISLDEVTSQIELNRVVKVFADHQEKEAQPFIMNGFSNDTSLTSHRRTQPYLTHPVFSSYRTETEMMRYLKRLENKDLSLCHSMIPLGSCTMKLNAAVQLMPITWPEFSDIHPFAPLDQCQGYQEMIRDLEGQLAEITGFHGVSLQPNSGAQGEYAGLMVIRAYQKSKGEEKRNVVLIPSSAHGTNPASAVMAGLKVVVVKCDDNGNIDLEDLRSKAEEHKEVLSSLMVTYPSTHGVFEEDIVEITDMIHDNGGQVYMDGANMNAQVGLTSPGVIKADVCHLNLHKTFAIPHGGGGPGMGPICVAEHLSPFLPSSPVINVGNSEAIPAISAAPWGSALILQISYAYISLLGANGLKRSSELAILNANYLYNRLKGYFDILYTGVNDTVAHEMIIDCRDFKSSVKIDVEDIAKRLMDLGFHAPTMSWPVPGTIMIEPTESESKEELDRFVDAMITIRKEISEIEEGKADAEDNPLKNAPHTMHEVVNSSWSHSYSREKAAFPLPYLRNSKFWPSVARIDNAYGDRNLMCTCPSVSLYESDEKQVEISTTEV
ncbi:MAG: aminomethyl-transferring glycine dehydrogenase [Flavobacteriales bacterium]|nr:aminomethyl-transferring glycine dehydrogenase [Flavobacteriales bacterium]